MYKICLFLCFFSFLSANYAQTPQQMVAAVNKVRAKGCNCGGVQMPPVPPIKWDTTLLKAATGHVNWMFNNNKMSHTGANKSSIGKRADAAGYKWMGVAENVAYGYDTFGQVLAGWLDSPGHCENIMGTYKHIAIARNGTYWCMDFGSPMRN